MVCVRWTRGGVGRRRGRRRREDREGEVRKVLVLSLGLLKSGTGGDRRGSSVCESDGFPMQRQNFLLLPLITAVPGQYARTMFWAPLSYPPAFDFPGTGIPGFFTFS